jgi:hypothetical protein
MGFCLNNGNLSLQNSSADTSHQRTAIQGMHLNIWLHYILRILVYTSWGWLLKSVSTLPVVLMLDMYGVICVVTRATVTAVTSWHEIYVSSIHLRICTHPTLSHRPFSYLLLLSFHLSISKSPPLIVVDWLQLPNTTLEIYKYNCMTSVHEYKGSRPRVTY